MHICSTYIVYTVHSGYKSIGTKGLKIYFQIKQTGPPRESRGPAAKEEDEVPCEGSEQKIFSVLKLTSENYN